MGDLIQNLSQVARDSLESTLQRIANNLTVSDSGNFTITNNLTVSGTFSQGMVAATSQASLSALNVNGLLSGFQTAFTSIASIGQANVYSTASAVNALVLSSTVVGGPTNAPLQIIASAASQSFFNFTGAIISTASINLAANKVAGVIQVTFNGGPAGQGIGYMPLFTGVI
jgi:hypothetical protein